MAHSPHRRWKGCPLCKPHKVKGNRTAWRATTQELRFMGRKRRIARGMVD